MRSWNQTAIKKGACLTGGFIFFGIGIAGMVLPLLPTTIFWIISAWLFTKAHPEMYQTIVTWPKIGPVIALYLEQGMIERPAKKCASMGIIIVGGLSLFLAQPPIFWTCVVLLILSVVISYILTRPSSPQTIETIFEN